MENDMLIDHVATCALTLAADRIASDTILNESFDAIAAHPWPLDFLHSSEDLRSRLARITA